MPITLEEAVSYHGVDVPKIANVPANAISVIRGDESLPDLTLISLPFRNVGAGAADVYGLKLKPDGSNWIGEPSTVRDRVVPVGEGTRAYWRLDYTMTSDAFVAAIQYGDARGSQLQETHLRVSLRHGSWSVTGVGAYAGWDGERELTVISGEWPRGT